MNKSSSTTFLDRAIGWLAPGYGLSRIKNRQRMSLAGSYTGAKKDRRATQNWKTSGASADSVLSPDLPTLRDRTSDLVRNAPLVSGALQTKSAYTIGQGLTVNPLPDRAILGLSKEQAKEWQLKARSEFALACKSLDYSGVQHFNDLQLLAFNSWLEKGDVFGLRRYREDPGAEYAIKIQLIEAERCSNPGRGADKENLVAGVELKASGAPAAYHFSDRHPDDFAANRQTNWRRVPARYKNGSPIVLHVFRRARVGQTRGIPFAAPIIETLKQYTDYSHAELTGAVTAALFTVFITSDGDSESSPVQGSSDGKLNDDDLALGAGAIVDLDAGEKIELADPKRPNTAFEAFVQAIAREIGVGLNLPYEMLLKHFSSSYSASRAALEMAWTVFRMDRAFFVRTFCQPIYEFVIEEAVLKGRLKAPGFGADTLIREAWLKAEWRGPARISLDPKKDAEADRLDIDTGVKTREQTIAERTGGGDFDSVNEQLAHEQAARETANLPDPKPTNQANQNNDEDDDA